MNKLGAFTLIPNYLVLDLNYTQSHTSTPPREHAVCWAKWSNIHVLKTPKRILRTYRHSMALQQHTPPSAFRASCFASWQLWVFEQPWNHSHQTKLVCPFSQNRHQKHLYVTICSKKIGRIEVGSISKYLDWQNKAFLHSPKYDESTKLIDTTAGGVCWDAGQLICQHGNCHFQTLRTHPCRVDVNRVTGLAESKVNMGTVWK